MLETLCPDLHVVKLSFRYVSFRYGTSSLGSDARRNIVISEKKVP